MIKFLISSFSEFFFFFFYYTRLTLKKNEREKKKNLILIALLLIKQFHNVQHLMMFQKNIWHLLKNYLLE